MGPGFESLRVHHKKDFVFFIFMQLPLNLLFVGRTRQMTQYTAVGGMHVGPVRVLRRGLQSKPVSKAACRYACAHIRRIKRFLLFVRTMYYRFV